MDKQNKTGTSDVFSQLQSACKTAHEYLKKNYDPHCQICISWDEIKVIRDEVGIPVKEIGQN